MCTKSEYETKEEVKNTYYPLEVGNEWVYRVDSLIISRSGQNKVESTVYMRERILSKEATDQGKVYRMERAFATDTSEEYQVRMYEHVEYSDFRVITNEDFRKVDIVYPIEVGNTWNALAYASKERQYFISVDSIQFYGGYSASMLSKEASIEIAGKQYSDVIKVVHMDDTSVVDKQYEQNIYGSGVGLLQRTFEAYSDNSGFSERPWIDRAKHGFKITKTLVDYDLK